MSGACVGPLYKLIVKAWKTAIVRWISSSTVLVYVGIVLPMWDSGFYKEGFIQLLLERHAHVRQNHPTTPARRARFDVRAAIVLYVRAKRPETAIYARMHDETRQPL